MKVLALSSYGVLGGGELSLAEYLARRPEEVHAEAVVLEAGPLADVLAKDGIPTRVASHAGRPSARDFVRFGRSLSRLLRVSRPDVVWATGFKAAVLAVPACRVHRVPIVWHKIDFSRDSTITKPLAACVNGVICVSEAVGQSLGFLRRRRLIAVIGPPVRLPPDAAAPPNADRIIGTLGRLVPLKGHDHILRAASRLRSEFPDLRVVLAGDGEPHHPDYPDELRALTRALDLENCVDFTGFVTDIVSLASRLRIYVNATHRDSQGYGLEGLSGAMLEASWLGLPVVAYRGGGTAEGMRNGVTGTLVERPDPEALADALTPYLRDHTLALRHGSAGRRFVQERFGSDLAAQNLFDALERAARRSRPR